MKKIISVLLALILALSLVSVCSAAGEVPVDKTGWQVEASSFIGGCDPERSIDGKRETYWHSYYGVEDGKAVNKAEPPHELTFTLPSETVISGFAYTPRTGSSVTGRVIKYELYGSDGSDKFILIGSGSFENSVDIKLVKFDNNIPVKKVKFRMLETVSISGVVAEFDLLAENPSLSKKALSEVSGVTLDSAKAEEKKAAEASKESGINVYADRSAWTADASSVMGHMNGSFTLDGKRETYWHTFYEAVDGVAANKTPPPYDLTISLGTEHVISGFVYTPREGNSVTGRVLKYEIYGSDGSDNFKLIATGEFASDKEIKAVKFSKNVPVKKVQFKILEVVGGCGVVAEFDLIKEDASLAKVTLSEVKSEEGKIVTADSVKTETKTEEPKTETKPADTVDADGYRMVVGEVPVDERFVNKNGWKAYAKESFTSGNTIEKSIDGDPKTFWHSVYTTKDGENERPPMPYDIIYVLPEATSVSGFCYTPRQGGGSSSGRVLEYEIYVTGDDSDNWIKITDGDFSNDDASKDIEFVCNLEVKKVMFRVLAGLNRYAVIGEFDLLVANKLLDDVALEDYLQYQKDNRKIYIDTNEIGAECDSVWVGHAATHAFDGNLGTFWHKNPSDSGTMLIKVDLNSVKTISGFTYYPRRDDIKGHWKKYNMYASVDGQEYFPVIEDGTFKDIDFTSKDVRFDEPVEFRYIDFEVLEYHGHAAAAEIAFYQTKEVEVATKKSEKYVLQIDNPVIKSEINGEVKETTLDVAPFIKNSNTMIPLRGLLESMGASVEWNGDNQSVAIGKGVVKIDMQIRNILVYVTNVKGTVRYSFRTAPIIKNGRTFIPLRFISENLGYNVAWDGETRTITITNTEEE